MAISLYMDVHIQRAIIDGLRLRGVDVLTTQEDEADQLPDPDLLHRTTHYSEPCLPTIGLPITLPVVILNVVKDLFKSSGNACFEEILRSPDAVGIPQNDTRGVFLKVRGG